MAEKEKKPKMTAFANLISSKVKLGNTTPKTFNEDDMKKFREGFTKKKEQEKK